MSDGGRLEIGGVRRSEVYVEQEDLLEDATAWRSASLVTDAFRVLRTSFLDTSASSSSPLCLSHTMVSPHIHG